eukprot:COSAG04_NODE_719_length_10829_cov_6.915750_10_plen_161_part_00
MVCGWCAGIACKLDSPGFAALKQATKEVKGNAEPYSICGSLPLVGDMQEDGFDVQVRGRLPHPSCAWYLGRSEGGGAGRCAASGSPASTMVRETSCLTSRGQFSRAFIPPPPPPLLTGGLRAGDNEYCKLSDMVDAVKILSRSLALVNESAGKRPQTPAS